MPAKPELFQFKENVRAPFYDLQARINFQQSQPLVLFTAIKGEKRVRAVILIDIQKAKSLVKKYAEAASILKFEQENSRMGHLAFFSG